MNKDQKDFLYILFLLGYIVAIMGTLLYSLFNETSCAPTLILLGIGIVGRYIKLGQKRNE